MRILIAASALLALSTACAPRAGTNTAGNGSPGTVKENHFARIPESQLAPVQEAREEVRDLRDELVRAEQQVAMADEQSKLGSANLDVERAKAMAAKQAFEVAQSTGDRARIAKAQSEQAVADAGIEVQLAKAELTARNRDTNDLAARAVRAKLGLAEAKLESVKFIALRESGDAAADEYKESTFQQAILTATNALEQAERATKDHEAIVLQAKTRLETAERAFSSLGEGDDRQPVSGEDTDPKTGGEPK